MAFTVETGAGLPTANSYVDVAEANLYFEDRSEEAWDEADQADKERALILATDYVDRRYQELYLGRRGSHTQRLAWPRVNARSGDGYILGPTEIPNLLKQAVVEAALRVVQGKNLMPDLSPGAAQISSKSVGDISVSYHAGLDPNVRFQVIEALMRPLLRGSGGRLVRG